MTVSKEVTRDLEDLLLDRLRTVCRDHFDSMMRMDAQPHEAVTSTGATLMGFAAELMVNISSPKRDTETGLLLTRTIRLLRERGL